MAETVFGIGARKTWRATAALSAVLLATLLGLSWIGFAAAERYYLARSANESLSTLRLAGAGLRGALDRFAPLPELVADRPEIRLLLLTPDDPLLVERVNARLKEIALSAGASDVYVLDRAGLTLAASNFDTNTSFVGRSFDYRPYFIEARDGGAGRYFALGTTSLKRGYFFAEPVWIGDRVLGVVTVKITVEGFESSWSGGQHEILVTDENGVIAMSSREAWRLKTLSPLTEAAAQEIETSRQYPIEVLQPLGYSTEPLGPGIERVALSADGAVADFVSMSAAAPQPGWTIRILTPTVDARARALTTLVTALLLLLLAALVYAGLRQRRAQLIERIEVQRQARTQLERRVAERTADLNAANKRLTREVEERVEAERQLRKTQADLVQAGKLAALGQMAAALSHEFNQPLAAVKSYAENAAAYLERERPGEARENVGRISELVDRMAAISRHLRTFARKPAEKLGAVPVAAAINDAVQILSTKLKTCDADLRVDLGGRDLWVIGGQVRLQQVLVNLISNALDSMDPTGTAPRRIDVTAGMAGERIEIRVRDRGPGLSGDVAEQMFDPFFTTKEVGQGLGLGLSISYNIVKDFGGNLSARNHPDGGAEFVIELNAAERLASTAAE